MDGLKNQSGNNIFLFKEQEQLDIIRLGYKLFLQNNINIDDNFNNNNMIIIRIKLMIKLIIIMMMILILARFPAELSADTLFIRSDATEGSIPIREDQSKINCLFKILRWTSNEVSKRIC